MRKDPGRGPHQQGSGSWDCSLPPTAFSAALPISPAAWGSGTERSPSAQTTCSGPALPSLCKMQLSGVIRTMRHGNKSTWNTSPNFTSDSKPEHCCANCSSHLSASPSRPCHPHRQCRGHAAHLSALRADPERMQRAEPRCPHFPPHQAGWSARRGAEAAHSSPPALGLDPSPRKASRARAPSRSGRGR